MEAIQLWLPTFAENNEACEELWMWDDYLFQGLRFSTIWILPPEFLKVEGYAWWDGIGGRSVVLQGEHLELIDVIHIGSNGYAYGISDRITTESRLDSNILHHWLETDLRKLEIDKNPTFEFVFPVLQEGVEGEIDPPEFSKETLEIRTSESYEPPFLSAITSNKINLTTGSIQRFEIISDGENFGKKLPVKIGPVMKPPKSLTKLFPYGIDINIYSLKGDMMNVSLKSGVDSFLSYRLTEWYLNKYSLLGKVLWGDAILYPLMIEFARQKRLDDKNIESILKEAGKSADPNLRKLIRRFDENSEEAIHSETEIRRVWGVSGLLWFLLRDEISIGARYKTCRRTGCSNVVVGTKAKLFCDDPTCFQIRDTMAHRKSRDKHRR